MVKRSNGYLLVTRRKGGEILRIGNKWEWTESRLLDKCGRRDLLTQLRIEIIVWQDWRFSARRFARVILRQLVSLVVGSCITCELFHRCLVSPHRHHFVH